jgi:hypothetical protein
MGAAVALSFGFAGAASALTASCSGVSSGMNITWSASSNNGVSPVAFLWGNGATTTPQLVSGGFGINTMTLQATDASSTVATTTCSTTITQSAPMISSFVATPATITTGQNSVLSWSVANASSTSINNGLGTISSTSVTVSPSVTTTYMLTATNPGGSSTANVTVTVGTTTGSSGGTNLAAIQALLTQIAALKSQLAQLLLNQIIGGTGTSTATTTPTCNFMRDLKKGDSGNDVKELQLSLAHTDPSVFPPGLITGFFGGKTEAALKILQKRYGISLSGTGFFGPMSRKFFKENCGKHNGEDQNDDNDEHHASSTQTWNSSSTVQTSGHGENENHGKGKGNDKGNGKHDD